MLNASTIVETSARLYPNKTAVIAGSLRMTNKEVDAAANQVAHALWDSGVRPGDRVALFCGANPYFITCYYGILKAGAVAVAMNTLMKQRELCHEIVDSGARALIAVEGPGQEAWTQEARAAFEQTDSCSQFWQVVFDTNGLPVGTGATAAFFEDKPKTFSTIQVSAEDTAAFIYTSGTTGAPKGAELTHMNIVMHAAVFKDVILFGKNDVMLTALPFYNVFGQIMMMHCGLASGATLVLLPRYEPGAVLRAMVEHNVTYFCGAPTMMRGLLHYPNLHRIDIETIRRNWRGGITGSAPVSPDLLSEMKRVFGVQLLTGYGLSETTCIASTTRYDLERKPHSVGVPIWGVEMCVVDDDMNEVPVGQSGEIVIRGHNVMKGYFKNPEATAEAFKGGWFHSGDIGKVDEDGHYYILDRKKDMIIRGGRKVYPSEVEAVMSTHQAVAVVAVIGVADEMYGEEIKAFVVCKPGASVTEESLISWCKDQMAAYAYPRAIAFVDNLPLGPTGKVLKKELRRTAAAAQ